MRAKHIAPDHVAAQGETSVQRFALASALLLGATACALAQAVPPGYPADYQGIIAAAEQEGSVVVYSTTDSASADVLLKDFRALYPKVQIRHHDLNSTEVYNRYLSEAAANAETADVLWSGSMDLQLKLVADGHALTYRSPEAGKMPKWAVYEDRAWGTTFEPLVIAYNKRLLPADAVPASRADLLRLLKERPQLFAGGKLTAYDPEKSGFAFLLMTQDEKYFPPFWELAAAFGRGAGRFYPSSGTMIERITSGEHLIGYNVIGSYVVLRQKKDPDLGLVYPGEYVLVMSRVALITKNARRPNAAKLFLDYILSARAQTIIANQAMLFSPREDVEGPYSAAALSKELGGRLKPIPADMSLLAALTPAKRLAMIRKWQETARAQ
jgi:iron(III) transport system substrate-binding protein